MHARLQDLERRRDVVGGVEHVEDGAIRPAQRRLQHEGELDLDPWRVEAIERNRRGVGIEHVGEQHAVIGLGDADGVLHRLRGQADLVALDDAAAAELQLGPGALDRVGVLDGEAGIVPGEHRDQRLGAFGFIEARARRSIVAVSSMIYCSAATTLRSTPIRLDSTSTTSPTFSQRGGSKRAPAPVGVPVTIMSPGFRVAKVER